MSKRNEFEPRYGSLKERADLRSQFLGYRQQQPTTYGETGRRILAKLASKYQKINHAKIDQSIEDRLLAIKERDQQEFLRKHRQIQERMSGAQLRANIYNAIQLAKLSEEERNPQQVIPSEEIKAMPVISEKEMTAFLWRLQMEHHFSGVDQLVTLALEKMPRVMVRAMSAIALLALFAAACDTVADQGGFDPNATAQTEPTIGLVTPDSTAKENPTATPVSEVDSLAELANQKIADAQEKDPSFSSTYFQALIETRGLESLNSSYREFLMDLETRKEISLTFVETGYTKSGTPYVYSAEKMQYIFAVQDLQGNYLYSTFAAGLAKLGLEMTNKEAIEAGYSFVLSENGNYTEITKGGEILCAINSETRQWELMVNGHLLSLEGKSLPNSTPTTDNSPLEPIDLDAISHIAKQIIGGTSVNLDDLTEQQRSAVINALEKEQGILEQLVLSEKISLEQISRDWTVEQRMEFSKKMVIIQNKKAPGTPTARAERHSVPPTWRGLVLLGEDESIVNPNWTNKKYTAAEQVFNLNAAKYGWETITGPQDTGSLAMPDQLVPATRIENGIYYEGPDGEMRVYTGTFPNKEEIKQIMVEMMAEATQEKEDFGRIIQDYHLQVGAGITYQGPVDSNIMWNLDPLAIPSKSICVLVPVWGDKGELLYMKKVYLLFGVKQYACDRKSYRDNNVRIVTDRFFGNNPDDMNKLVLFTGLQQGEKTYGLIAQYFQPGSTVTDAATMERTLGPADHSDLAIITLAVLFIP